VRGSGLMAEHVRPGGTWRRARTSGPSQDATLASGAVGLRKSRTAQLLREAARAACAIGTRSRAAFLSKTPEQQRKKSCVKKSALNTQ
jgi:hypothetical protein